MNSTCIFVMDAICYAHIPVEYTCLRSGALAPGRVGFVIMSQLNIGHIDVICNLLCAINIPQYLI